MFDVAVTVSGMPELELDVGGAARTAAYASGSGSTGLTFAYTVAEGDADADGVAIGADKLTAAGGATIAADGTPAVLTHEATSDDGLHKVDGVRPLLVRAATTADGGSILLTYDEELSSMTAGVGAFTVTVAGTARAVGTVAAGGATVTLTLTVALTRDEQELEVTLGYADPTAGADDAAAVQDAAGNDAAGFQGRQVLTLPVVTAGAGRLQSIAEDDGESTVTATVSRGWTEAFTVTVTATPVAPADGERLHAQRQHPELRGERDGEQRAGNHHGGGQRRGRPGQDGDGGGDGEHHGRARAGRGDADDPRRRAGGRHAAGAERDRRHAHAHVLAGRNGVHGVGGLRDGDRDGDRDAGRRRRHGGVAGRRRRGAAGRGRERRRAGR